MEKVYEPAECINCGAMLEDLEQTRFCDPTCEHEYYYKNRTCDTCGGEYWDGGTSCTCDDYYGEDGDEEEEDFWRSPPFKCEACGHFQHQGAECEKCQSANVEPVF